MNPFASNSALNNFDDCKRVIMNSFSFQLGFINTEGKVQAEFPRWSEIRLQGNCQSAIIFK